MPEIKNIFIKSKMNQDIDDRLVPKGEYRKALNVAISRSEGSDVGTVQNVLGNSLISITEISGVQNLDIIGYYIDQSQNDIYLFLTDYIDSSSSGIANFAPSTANCFIYKYNATSNSYTKLVEGYYLNFSKNSLVQGVNIIEGLLFFTDNRNQPRKINVSTASINSTYYNTEDKISVAKYYPYTPISLVNLAGDDLSESTMTNPFQQYLDIEKGGEDYDNPDYDEEWAGDPELLSDKFVRFSYRFKFDDGEYSLQAPWTQICFIPKQQGYFNTEDAKATYRSTVVSFMENNVTQILLNIKFPTENPIEDLNISSVDILYKESDGLAIKVVETIPATTVYAQMKTNANNLVYSYKYISTKPYKTLPSSESTRVYDTVPVRALTQEIISNRVVYGNFFNKQTPPDSLNYGVGYGVKDNVSLPVEKVYSQIEYPSSSLKQNRNYQAAFVLADRFGRQSSAILSAKDSGTTRDELLYGGSTVYVAYADSSINALNFPGYELKVLVDVIEGGTVAIPVSPNLSTGYPGVYKDNLKGVDAAIINQAGTGYSGATNVSTTGGSGTGCTVDIITNGSGEIISVTINNQGTGYTNGDVIIPSGAGSNGSFTVTVYDPNPLGWYSYKIVVKQTEQEYYNVYLPGILDGYPFGSPLNPGGASEEVGQTANIVLFSDNINKVPKDLSEVGPDQRQYRSSVNLFGRVAPYTGDGQESTFSTQYYPTALPDSIPSIATLRDTNYVAAKNKPGELGDLSYNEFYQSDTNPSIARISTSSSIGKPSSSGPATDAYGNSLSVYETGAVTSLLDIYWETSTVGLIYELNKIVQGGFGGPTSILLSNDYQHLEGEAPDYLLLSGKAVDSQGGSFASGQIAYSLTSVLDDAGAVISQFNGSNQSKSGVNCYNLVSGDDGFTLSISSDTYFYYKLNPSKNNFTFTVDCYDNLSGASTFLEFTGSLSNTAPNITSPINEDPVSFSKSTGVSAVVLMQGENGVNIGANIATRSQELVWSMGDVTKSGTSGTSSTDYGFSINPDTGLVSVSNNEIEGGSSYSMSIILTDSGGETDVFDLTVDVISDSSITFFAYSSNFYYDGDNNDPLPEVHEMSYIWKDESGSTESAIIFSTTEYIIEGESIDGSSTKNVYPYPNEYLKSKIIFRNQPFDNEPEFPRNAFIYVYKGNPGIGFNPVIDTLPDDVEEIFAYEVGIPPSYDLDGQEIEIPLDYQTSATSFSTYIIFDVEPI